MFSIFNTTPRILSDCLARSIQQARVVYLLLHVRSTLLFSTYPPPPQQPYQAIVKRLSTVRAVLFWNTWLKECKRKVSTVKNISADFKTFYVSIIFILEISIVN